MDKYRVVIKPVYRKKFTGIMCFLADAAYTDEDIESGKNRSKALCWVAHKEDIEKLVNQYQNINVIVTAQLIKWKLESQNILEELQAVVPRQQLDVMVATMENFIKNTISNLYD